MIKSIWVGLFLIIRCHFAAAQGVYPVYFADVIKDQNKVVLHFEWRPDFTGKYDKAIINNAEGAVIVELKYPNNHYVLQKSSEKGNLFITAVSNSGEKSVAVEVETNRNYSEFYENGSTEQIIIQKEKGQNARFVGAQSGTEFITKGINFCGIRLGDHDTFEPNITAKKPHIDRVNKLNSTPFRSLVHEVLLGEEIFFYDVYRTEILMRTIKEKGFNLVRVFVKTGGRGSKWTGINGLSGPSYTKGLYAPYMENFVHFLTTAQKYGIYVMPCFAENEMLDNDYFKNLANGATKQAILFSKDGIIAKQHYLELFLNYIKNKNPKLINSLFALTMQNEFAFHCDEPPFNQNDGNYTFLDGKTYNMKKASDRRSLANAAIRNYYAKMKEVVEVNAPGLLIGEGTFAMGAVGKDYKSSMGIRKVEGVKDLRFPMTVPELLNTDIDFLDFHVYRWEAKGNGRDIFNNFGKNMKLFTNETKKIMKSKPIIMGEFGSFKKDEKTIEDATVFVSQLNQAAQDFGFKGSVYWTIDTFVQTRLWNLMSEGGKMLNAFNE